MNKIYCSHCGNPIGEMHKRDETYYHKNKIGKVVCLTCEFNKRNSRAQTSFFIIFVFALIVVIYLAIKGL